jgi:hypothetical protein
MPTPLALSTEALGWARTAHYVTAVADDRDVQIRSEADAPTRTSSAAADSTASD